LSLNDQLNIHLSGLPVLWDIRLYCERTNKYVLKNFPSHFLYLGSILQYNMKIYQLNKMRREEGRKEERSRVMPSAQSDSVPRYCRVVSREISPLTFDAESTLQCIAEEQRHMTANKECWPLYKCSRNASSI
jgi:hypothetical protein